VGGDRGNFAELITWSGPRRQEHDLAGYGYEGRLIGSVWRSVAEVASRSDCSAGLTAGVGGDG
jgi:hypothetical protein